MVLEEPLAVSGAVPEDVSVVAVAPVGLAVAIDLYVVDSPAGFASSLLKVNREVVHGDLVEHDPILVVGMDLATRDKVSFGDDEVASGTTGEA